MSDSPSLIVPFGSQAMECWGGTTHPSENSKVLAASRRLPAGRGQSESFFAPFRAAKPAWIRLHGSSRVESRYSYGASQSHFDRARRERSRVCLGVAASHVMVSEIVR